MKKSIRRQLQEVFSQPTAPYREAFVLSYIFSELKQLKVPHFQDEWGNIICGAKNKRELASLKEIKYALVAHTDHPGFHLVKSQKAHWLAQWFGGCPPKIKGSKVRAYSKTNKDNSYSGIVTSSLNKRKIFKIKFNKKLPAGEYFGTFDLPSFKIKRGVIESRAADDLAGVTIILSVLRRLTEKERRKFVGLFTTAEETGFKGAIGFVKSCKPSVNLQFISLEASRELPGAKMGLGPVIRQGDYRTLFNQDLTALIEQGAKKVKYQKRIMNGGSCEASAFHAFGFVAAGMAVPLGNYHNQKTNGKPGPEKIHIEDVEGAVKILVQFYKNAVKKQVSPKEKFAKLLLKEFKKSQRYFEK